MPLIRFRYGASRDSKPATVSTTAQSVSKKPSSTSQSGEPIYDFQIPQRWRRRPISEEEIAFINRGGPD